MVSLFIIIYTIIHDIYTPVTAITLYIDYSRLHLTKCLKTPFLTINKSAESGEQGVWIALNSTLYNIWHLKMS